MITIITESGAHHIQATAEEVTVGSGHLKIVRDGTTIADFRRWTAFYETDQEEVRP